MQQQSVKGEICLGLQVLPGCQHLFDCVNYVITLAYMYWRHSGNWVVSKSDFQLDGRNIRWSVIQRLVSLCISVVLFP